jgi:hypothetical protein
MIVAWVTLTVLSILVPSMYYFLQINSLKLEVPDFNIKYGTMYQYMKTNFSEAYHYFVYFLLRRLLFSVSIVFLTMSPGPQLQI